MSHTLNLKKRFEMVYRLSSTRLSVIKYVKKRKIYIFSVWNDDLKLRKKVKSKSTSNLRNALSNAKLTVWLLSRGKAISRTSVYVKVFALRFQCQRVLFTLNISAKATIASQFPRRASRALLPIPFQR